MPRYTVRDRGYVEIENYIVNDYSSDCVETLDMMTDILYIRNIYLPSPKDKLEGDIFNELYGILSKKGVDVYEIDKIVELDDVRIIYADEEWLPRSSKRLVCFSVESATSRYTYVGASVFEGTVSNDFAERYIGGSDIVCFGSYGAKYKIPFNYDINGVDYLVVTEVAQPYSNCEDENVKKVGIEQVFILK